MGEGTLLFDRPIKLRPSSHAVIMVFNPDEGKLRVWWSEVVSKWKRMLWRSCTSQMLSRTVSSYCVNWILFCARGFLICPPSCQSLYEAVLPYPLSPPLPSTESHVFHFRRLFLSGILFWRRGAVNSRIGYWWLLWAQSIDGNDEFPVLLQNRRAFHKFDVLWSAHLNSLSWNICRIGRGVLAYLQDLWRAVEYQEVRNAQFGCKCCSGHTRAGAQKLAISVAKS